MFEGLMLAAENVNLLMPISAFGIYLHAVFVSFTLGLPFVISAFIYKWWKTKDEDYYRAARIATGVLGVNFALGAITGTLVEFGLVQAWPGSIYVIATVAFVPLASELIAFVGEIVFLIAFIVTLRWVKPVVSIGLMAGYFVFAALSGALITMVNSWLNVPWGTGPLAAVLNPYLPEYGPAAYEIPVLVAVKLTLVDTLFTTGTASQILQSPEVAQAVGFSLKDPFIALQSPYAVVSVFHNVTAAIIIGIAFAAAALAIKHFRTGDEKFVKLLRSIVPMLLVLVLIQPTLFGDNMGKAVATYMPTKFAMIEGAYDTTENPLIAFLAYGDPSKPIPGFNEFKKKCDTLGDTTVENVASQVLPSYRPGPSTNIKLRDLCMQSLAEAEVRIPLINASYVVKIGSGVIAFVAAIALAATVYDVKGLTKVAKALERPFGRKKFLLLLTLLIVIGSVLPSSLGWFIREVGRKPWTVYGLLTPNELVTPVPVSFETMALFTLAFGAMAFGGMYGMYLVAAKPLEFVKLLRKGAGVEE
ncbi:MAG: cytochrome ubiquinol oxidase subunit I [Candidatus Caldarchaeum sp.]